MKRAQHTEHCKQLIGFDGFPEVHDYLDQHADTVGPGHRKILHNEEGVRHCIRNWGWLGGAAACIHIWADEVGLIQTNEGKFDLAPEIGSAHPAALTEEEIKEGYSA